MANVTCATPAGALPVYFTRRGKVEGLEVCPIETKVQKNKEIAMKMKDLGIRMVHLFLFKKK